MSSRYAVKRAERAGARDFPARPTLSTDQAWIGAALVLDRAAPPPDFRPLRDQLRGLWRGSLTDGAEVSDIVVAIFMDPVAVAGVLPPATLPLMPAAAGGLVSYIALANPPAPATTVRPEDIRRIRIWWNGREHAIALDRLAVLPLADLWDLPRLTVHEPTPPPASQAGPAARAKDERSGGEGLVPVGKAKGIGEDLRDSIAEVEAGVRDLEDRTRLKSIIGQLFGRKRTGSGDGADASGRGRKAGGAGSDGPAREPGVLENLAGWIRWHTPLGAGLRGQLNDRLKLVEKLMSSGDLDSALKLALALGGGNGAKKHAFPQGLPGQRDSLDFNYQGGGVSAPIFSPTGYHSLQARYLDLARQLERQGDFRRAAYVHAQLLGNPIQAVLTLEAGGLFAEGAKLAIQSKQAPTIAIRLLYKAGETDAALALARRAACFDQLADESRTKDPHFHAYVLMAWSEMLIATDQPLRALQVTDALVGAAQAPADLSVRRAAWLEDALWFELPSGGVGADLAARGVLTGPWRASAATDLELFPYGPAPVGGAFAALIAWLQTVLRGEASGASQVQIELLHALTRHARPDDDEQVVFWEGPAPRFLEAFARALLEDASHRLGPREIEALRGLLDKAGLPVMAADISKLSKIYVTPAGPSRHWRLPAAVTARPAIRQACVLGSGEMLAWRESRLLQLLDRHGGVSWQQPLSDVVGLVPVGSGANAIVIQSQADGSRLLTRFSSRRRTFHAIGKVALRAYHDVTAEGHWLVQIGGEMGALDVVKLCAPVPEVEFLWSSALTERLLTVAFGETPHATSWITRDVSAGRQGVLELWTRRATGVETRLCRPRPIAPSDPAFTIDWAWHIESWHGQIRPSTGTGGDMPTVPWVVDLERQAVADAADRLALTGAYDTFQACDLGRPYIAFGQDQDVGSGHVQTQVVEAGTRRVAFTFDHTVPLRCLARGAALAGGSSKTRPILLADEAGRLFMLDLTTTNLLVV